MPTGPIGQNRSNKKSFPYDYIAAGIFISRGTAPILWLCCCGDIDPVKAEEIIREHFGRVPKTLLNQQAG